MQSGCLALPTPSSKLRPSIATRGGETQRGERNPARDADEDGETHMRGEGPDENPGADEEGDSEREEQTDPDEGLSGSDCPSEVRLTDEQVRAWAESEEGRQYLSDRGWRDVDEEGQAPINLLEDVTTDPEVISLQLDGARPSERVINRER